MLPEKEPGIRVIFTPIQDFANIPGLGSNK